MSKPFTFDQDYRKTSSSTERKRDEGKLVSFFDDEPAPSKSTEWSAATVTEEDMREGMDDTARGEDASEELKDLIARMPHNRRG